MAAKPAKYKRKSKPSNKRKSKSKSKFTKKTFIKPIQRLSGTSRMPYFRYFRAMDLAPLSLSTHTHSQPGLWIFNVSMKISDIPNYTKFTDMYRYVRVDSVAIQYSPSTRSDEYSKIFPYPAGGAGGVQPIYESHGGALEIKQLRFDGFQTITSWEEALNRSGKLRKCYSTKPFTKLVKPSIHQIITDTVSTDPVKITRCPWLSTDIPNNLTMDMYLGTDVMHTLNNYSYDSASPLLISVRHQVNLSFKGLKI